MFATALLELGLDLITEAERREERYYFVQIEKDEEKIKKNKGRVTE